MTVKEISDSLDVLLGPVKLNEYDKSVYLTQAQEFFVDKILKVYEYGEEIRNILGPLLVTKEEVPQLVTGNKYSVPLADDIKAIIYEVCDDERVTVPLDWNDIHYTLKNPFREPNEDIALRTTFNGIAYIYAVPSVSKYTYTYCKTPLPIVLEDLPDSLAINGVNTPTTCELPDGSTDAVIQGAFNLIMKNKSLFMPKEEKPKQE